MNLTASNRRKVTLAALVSGLLAMLAGYVIAHEQIGTAESYSAPAQASPHAAVPSAAELSAELAEHRVRGNHVPSGPVSPILVESCTTIFRQSDDPEANQGCEVVLLASEGRVAPGTYSDAEIDQITAANDPTIDGG